MVSFPEKLRLIAAKTAVLLVKLFNGAGYCYRVNIFFSAWGSGWRSWRESKSLHSRKAGFVARLFFIQTP
jgi:hypothetical protein